MAEDDADMDMEYQGGGEKSREDGGEKSREERVRRTIDREHRQRKEKCRPRIDVLATPNRRLILDLYLMHANHLPEDKVQKIKKNLQELYAMTPEETSQYFSQLQAQSRALALRREMKSNLRRLVRKRNRARQRARAYKLFEKVLKRGFEYAFYHPVPPLVSVRLRHLSDIVLEQICDLRNVTVPKRDDPDKVGLLLIAIADWLAIAIEHLYYNVQLKKNKELEEIEAEEEQKRVMAEKKQAQEKKKDRKMKEAKSEEVRVEDLDNTDRESDKGAITSEVLLSEVE